MEKIQIFEFWDHLSHFSMKFCVFEKSLNLFLIFGVAFTSDTSVTKKLILHNDRGVTFFHQSKVKLLELFQLELVYLYHHIIRAVRLNIRSFDSYIRFVTDFTLVV